MTFGEHTEYEYETAGSSLKQAPARNKLNFITKSFRLPSGRNRQPDDFGKI